MLHGETLLVVASSDSDNIALPFITEVISWHFLGHTLLVEVLDLLFIVDFEDLLAPGLREGDVEFHLESPILLL